MPPSKDESEEFLDRVEKVLAKERSQHYLSEQRKIPIENYKDLLGSHLRCVEDNQELNEETD